MHKVTTVGTSESKFENATRKVQSLVVNVNHELILTSFIGLLLNNSPLSLKNN